MDNDTIESLLQPLFTQETDLKGHLEKYERGKKSENINLDFFGKKGLLSKNPTELIKSDKEASQVTYEQLLGYLMGAILSFFLIEKKRLKNPREAHKEGKKVLGKNNPSEGTWYNALYKENRTGPSHLKQICLVLSVPKVFIDFLLAASSDDRWLEYVEFPTGNNSVKDTGRTQLDPLDFLNRKEQIELIKDVSNNSNLLICIVHGYPNQCLDDFVRRLRYQELAQIYNLSEMDTVAYANIKWPSLFKNKKDLHKKLREGFYASEYRSENLILIETLAHVKPWKKLQSESENVIGESIKNYCEFWQKLKLEKEQTLVVCLCIKYKYGDNYRDLNNAIESCLSNLQNEQCFVLPRLDDVSQEEVEEWISDYREHENFPVKLSIRTLGAFVDKLYTEKDSDDMPIRELFYELENFIWPERSRREKL